MTAYIAWTLEGDRVSVWERCGTTYYPAQMGTGSNTVSARAAGLLSHLFRDRGETALAEALWAARAAWSRTEAGRAAAVVAQPVWGQEAGAGPCHNCDADCVSDERHYYAFANTGTLALCLDCGPDETGEEQQ